MEGHVSVHVPSVLVHRAGEREGWGVRGREASRCPDRGQRAATWLWPLTGSTASCFGLRVSPGLATKSTLVQLLCVDFGFLLPRAFSRGPPEQCWRTLWKQVLCPGCQRPPLDLPGWRSPGRNLAHPVGGNTEPGPKDSWQVTRSPC